LNLTREKKKIKRMLDNSWILAGWLEAGLGWLGSRRLMAGPQMTGLLMAGPQMAGPLLAGP